MSVLTFADPDQGLEREEERWMVALCPPCVDDEVTSGTEAEGLVSKLR